MPKPLLALTLGDPAGVGPEVIAGAWPSDEIHRICRPLVIGHPAILQRAVELRRVPAQVQLITEPEQAEPAPDRIPVWPWVATTCWPWLPARSTPARARPLTTRWCVRRGWRSNGESMPSPRLRSTRPRYGKPDIIILAIPNCWPNCAA